MRVWMLLGIVLVGCINDPYDPWLGGRNPVPGARNYLDTRADITPEQKDAFLHFRPTSVDILQKLSTAPVREVRAIVAANPSTDIFLFEQLIQDKETSVHQYVASNSHTPRSILLKLKNRLSLPSEFPMNSTWTADDIRQMYAEHLIKDQLVGSASLFAGNPSAPIDVLEKLLKIERYDSSSIRGALACNPAINAAIIEKLAQDTYPHTRLTLLRYNNSRRVTRERLKALLNDPDKQVKEAASYALTAKMKRATEAAIRLKSKGIDIETIAKTTELSIDEIQHLQVDVLMSPISVQHSSKSTSGYLP
jgi:hypothetical protein